MKKSRQNLFRKLSLLLATILIVATVWAQGKIIKGVVTDNSNQPIPGVSVIVRGTTQGTITDSEGNFTLSNVPVNASVQFSFIGMKTKEIPVSGKTSINVTLTEEAVGIEEVVAVGYGTLKKSDLTGSVSSIKSDKLLTGAPNSLEKQLSGKIAGVHVTQTGGQPGSGTVIRIRGTNSILGNNDPLFVVDGVPVGSSLGSNINPNDIESLEVLKDASATAIYGSRGSNGVVLITTKQGRTGQNRLTLDSYYGFNVLDKKLDLLNAEEVAEIHSRAINNGFTQLYDPSTVQGQGTDWQDEIYKVAPSQNYQLTSSGGNEDIKYLFSGNYFDEEGILINTEFQRFSFRSNLNFKINEKFRIVSFLYTAKTIQQSANNGQTTGAAIRANPIFEPYNEAGEYNLFVDGTNQTPNPLGNAEEIKNRGETSTILSNVYGEYELIKNLKLMVGVAANQYNNKFNTFYPRTVNLGASVNGSATINQSNAFNWISTNTLTYEGQISGLHHINAIVGFTAEKSRNETLGAMATDFVTDKLEYYRVQSANKQFTSSELFENQLASFIGRINYSFADKYLFTVSGRYDGSSKFGATNKWAFFPSIAGAWRISNEDFMKDQQLISNLKLRASMGVSGEQAIPSYATLPSLSSTDAIFAGNILRIGYYPNNLENPNLKWEKTTQTDVGIDVGFWEGKVNLTADYYYKKTTDLLYSVPVPSTTGYTSVIQNVGSIENKGLEFNISTTNLSESFTWTTDFNLAFNRNKVLDLGTKSDGKKIERILSPEGSENHLDYLGNKYALIVGEPIGGAYGFTVDGVYHSQAEIDAGLEPEKRPGDPRKVDINNSGEINDDDRSLISNPNPDFIGGMINTFTYKGLDLTFNLQWVYGNTVYNYAHFELSYLDGNQNTFSWALDGWTENNADSNIPRAGYNNRETGMSTLHVEDGSFLRAKNITLGYNFSKNNKFLGIQKIRLYASIDNAITITNYGGYNPDISAYGSNSIMSGFDYYTYPLAKTYMLGLNLEF